MNDYVSALLDAKLMAPQHLWLLWLLVPYGLFLWFGRARRGLISTLLRLCAVALVIFCLTDPVKTDSESSRQLSALIDVSYSVSKGARQELLEELTTYLPKGTSLKLLPFAKRPATRPLEIESGSSAGDLAELVEDSAAQVDTGETDLAAAINEIISTSQSASVLLMSDGFETAGNARQAALSAQSKGARIFPLVPGDAAFRSEQLTISSLHAPVIVNAGDKAEVRVSLKNPRPREAGGLLELWLGKDKLYAQRIRVAASEERLITVKTPALKGGLERLRAVFLPDGAGSAAQRAERHRWISVKEKSKLLLISGAADDQRVVKELLQLKGYGLENVIADGSTSIPTDFVGYSSIVLNNVSREQLPKQFLPALKQFVEGGGGLLLLGGDRSYGLGRYIGTPLEEISPLKFVPPQTKKRRLTVAVILVVDKSGSMAQENKIEATKQAAMMSIESLKDDDFVGVIGFDHAPFVIIDLEQVGQAKLKAARRLENLTAAGQTNLLPALSAARAKLRPSNASRKHIIVMSDGKFPLSSDAYIAEINKLRQEGVSVSAVALGIEADVPFMKILAKYGKGAFYHTLDATRLPQIFVEDIKVSTGELTMKENQDFPVGLGPDGLASTTLRRYPPLRGFVETLPKKGATLELITQRSGTVFPVLASWTYGRGRVIAFTSDANGRWSLPWLRWKDFPKFWGQVAEQIRNRSDNATGEVEFDLRYSVNRRAITLDLAVFDDKLRTQASPKITAQVIEPGGELKQLVFRGVKKGRFVGVIENGRPGDYKLRIDYGKLKLPPLALTVGGEAFGESPGKGINLQNLEEIAMLTGGAVNPDPSVVISEERISERNERLFPPLALLALALLLLEAFIRELGLPSLFRVGRKEPAQPSRRPRGRYDLRQAA